MFKEPQTLDMVVDPVFVGYNEMHTQGLGKGRAMCHVPLVHTFIKWNIVVMMCGAMKTF